MRKIVILLPLALSLLTGCTETQNLDDRTTLEEKSEFAPLPQNEEDNFDQDPPGGIFHLKPRDKIAEEKQEGASSKKPDCNIPGQCEEEEEQILDPGKKISAVFEPSDVDSKSPVIEVKPVNQKQSVDDDD